MLAFQQPKKNPRHSGASSALASSESSLGVGSSFNNNNNNNDNNNNNTNNNNTKRKNNQNNSVKQFNSSTSKNNSFQKRLGQSSFSAKPRKDKRSVSAISTIPSSENIISSQSELKYDSILGPLIQNVEQSFFSSHKNNVRPPPKFIIYQSPALVFDDIEQDEWDKQNQQNMVNTESRTSDLSSLQEEFQALREKERTEMENRGLVDKEGTRKTLEDAIAFRGTCYDMCPVYERVRRSVENDVKRYEKDPTTGKISPNKAIKAFSRPAAGQPPPLPSDVRPPRILSNTLDYIIDELLPLLPESQSFIWDRTRSIRQDFTYQNYFGYESVDCTERIVRIHILTLHVMAKTHFDFSQQQELEQMNKAMKSLAEMYTEYRVRDIQAPNEAEFRAYYLLSQLRDPELEREIQTFPQEILNDSNVQLALFIRGLVQTNKVERGFQPLENGLHFFISFFNFLKDGKTPILLLYLIEIHLNEIRFYSVKSLRRSLHQKSKIISFDHFKDLLLFNDDLEAKEFCIYYGLTIVNGSNVDLSSLKFNSHVIPNQKPLSQSFISRFDSYSSSSYKNIINSGKDNSIISKKLEEIGIVKKSGISPFDSRANSRVNSLSSNVSVPVELVSSGFNFGNLQQTSGFSFGTNESNVSSQLSSFGLTSSIQQPQQQQIGLPKGPIAPAAGFSFASSQPNLQAQLNPENSEIELKKEMELLEKQKQKELKEKQIQEELKKKEVELQLQRKRQQIQEERARREAEEKSKLGQKNQLIKNISNLISNDILAENVGTIINQITLPLIQEKKIKLEKREKLIDRFSEGLYEAFIAELIFKESLNIIADKFRENKLKLSIIKKFKTISDDIIQREEMKKRKRNELIEVSKNFGIPRRIIKRKKIKNENSFTTVNNEIDLTPLSFSKLITNFKIASSENCEILLFIENMEIATSRYLKRKFHIENELTKKITENSVELTIACTNEIKLDFLNNVNIFIFNCDGIETIKRQKETFQELINGIEFNSNFKIEVLIIYWEFETIIKQSPQDILEEFLSFNNSIILDIKILKLDGTLDSKLLQSSIDDLGKHFELTKRGEFNLKHLNQKPRNNDKNYDNMTAVNKNSHFNKVSKINELEKISINNNFSKKNNEKTKEMFKKLMSHIEASPKVKKIPVLQSGSSKKEILKKQSSKIEVVKSEPKPITSKIDVFSTPRPKSSNLLQTPSYFNESTSSNISNLSNITFANNSSSTPILALNKPTYAQVASFKAEPHVLTSDKKVELRSDLKSDSQSETFSNSDNKETKVSKSILELRKLAASVRERHGKKK